MVEANAREAMEALRTVVQPCPASKQPCTGAISHTRLKILQVDVDVVPEWMISSTVVVFHRSGMLLESDGLTFHACIDARGMP